MVVSRQATIVATLKGVRAAAGGGAGQKTAFFCPAIFTLNRQVKRAISLERRYSKALSLVALVFTIFCLLGCQAAESRESLEAAWWFWPLLLGVFCFFIGLVAVFAGIGGGVLFVPLAGALFPFHLDFIRGAGLLIALAGALAASPQLLRGKVADIRLGLPPALAASCCSILGARLGLAMPAYAVHLSLGALILGVALLTWRSKSALYPQVAKQDVLGAALGMHGVHTDAATGHTAAWKTHRTGAGLLLFCGIGIIAGMFGLGAGWANVPVLNLVMGAPFKLAVGTSSFILSLSDSSAAWVYIHNGCVIPLMAIPAILGLMAGARTGVHFMIKTRPSSIRVIVIIMLAAAGLRSLHSGLAHFL